MTQISGDLFLEQKTDLMFTEKNWNLSSTFIENVFGSKVLWDLCHMHSIRFVAVVHRYEWLWITSREVSVLGLTGHLCKTYPRIRTESPWTSFSLLNHKQDQQTVELTNRQSCADNIISLVEVIKWGKHVARPRPAVRLIGMQAACSVLWADVGGWWWCGAALFYMSAK